MTTITQTSPPESLATGPLSGAQGLPLTFWLFGIGGTLLFHGLLYGLIAVTPWVTLEIAAELLKVAFAAMVCEAVMNASARYQGPFVWVVLARIWVVATLLLSLAWYYGLFQR
jgi:hypothetical protein